MRLDAPDQGHASRRSWRSPRAGADCKDAAEHVVIVDLEARLPRVCEPGSVRWPELMAPRALAGVEHMVSTVEGWLRDGVRHPELLAATFPGVDHGRPKIAAVDLIAEIEPVGRGARWARSVGSMATETSISR